MDQEEQRFCHRMEELAARADSRGYQVFSEFLNMAEQDLLLSLRLPAPPVLYGGFDTAERRVACFGEDAAAYAPISCVIVRPRAQKFADTLSHRDILGALMSLGIRREVLGDILLEDNCGYVFCLDTIASYLVEQLTQVRHTAVTCALTDDIPQSATVLPPPTTVNVSSVRLDAMLAAVYHLSRSEAQRLITQKLVFVNSRLTQSAACSPAPGSVISVRGHGRFLFEEDDGQTRRGRLRIIVRIFQ